MLIIWLFFVCMREIPPTYRISYMVLNRRAFALCVTTDQDMLLEQLSGSDVKQIIMSTFPEVECV